MNKAPKRGMRVVLRTDLIVGKEYGDRTYVKEMQELQGQIIVARDCSNTIFNTTNTQFIFHKEMVTDIVDLDEDELFDVYVRSGMKDEEYIAIRRERGYA